MGFLMAAILDLLGAGDKFITFELFILERCVTPLSMQFSHDKTFGIITLRIKQVFIDTITYFPPKKRNRAIFRTETNISDACRLVSDEAYTGNSLSKLTNKHYLI